jgi:hypothetical protein
MSELAKQLRDVADKIEAVESELVQTKEWLAYKKDEPVMFRKGEATLWRKGHFSCIENLGGVPFPTVWANGCTSWTTTASFPVGECRRPTPAEIEAAGDAAQSTTV